MCRVAGRAVALLAAAASVAVAANVGVARVPAGPFTMGSDDGPQDERPAHVVTLAAFEIDVLPVTNAQFAGFLNAFGLVGAKGERYYDDDDHDARIERHDGVFAPRAGHSRHPVTEVSWPGARAYCAAQGKRLPTEAEWEKAARGTDARRFPWGNTPPDASRARFAAGYMNMQPVDAARAGASPFGVLDLAGNAWEWVSSAYAPYPYRHDDGREDPSREVVRGTRGGGHNSPVDEITTTQRGRNVSRAPNAGHHNIGFRCARSV